MTKFVYSRVLTLRETINVFAPDEKQADEILRQDDKGGWFSSDRVVVDHDEELAKSPWMLTEKVEMPTCSVCGKDLVDRPSVFGEFTVCAPCVRLARDLREERFINTIAEMVSERHPTTPDATAHTAPPEHTPH